MSERAWAAGFFDGEGYIGYVKHGSSRQRTYRRLVCAVAQARREPLERFRRAVGVGTVRGPYRHKNTAHSPYWQWSTQSVEGVLQVEKILHRYLCAPKRSALRRAIAQWREYKKGEHARYVASGKIAAAARWGRR